MRGRLAKLWLLVGAVFLHGGVLRAQDVPEDFSSRSYREQLDPAWGVSPGPLQARPRYRGYASVDIGVPVMLDVDHQLVRPGANLHAQGGLDFDYVAVFLHGGWRWLPVDFNRAAEHDHDSYGQTGRTPLKNPYFGFGVRGQLPNASIFLPYLSMSFDFNFFNFRESAIACTYWWCGQYDVYRFAPGFSWRAGSAIQLGQEFWLDLGIGVSLSFQGDFFEQNRAWVEPYLGATHRF